MKDPLSFGAEEVAVNDVPVQLGDPPAATSPAWQHYPEPPALQHPDGDHGRHQAPTFQTLPGTAGDAGATPLYPPIPAVATTPRVSITSGGTASAGGSPTSAAAAAAAPLGLASPSAARQRELREANPALRIHVRSPMKLLGPSPIPGIDESFMTYEVATCTSLPSFSANEFVVRRRFSDFVSLARLLPKLHPGCFLPARPEKNAIAGRVMAEAFVEQRRAALERYLCRLAAHPVAGGSEALRVFLEADGNLRSNPQWLALKPRTPNGMQATTRFFAQLVGAQPTAPSPTEVVRPAGQARDVYRLVHEGVAQLTGALSSHSGGLGGGARVGDVGASIAEGRAEAVLRDATVLLDDLSTNLRASVAAGDRWLKRLGEVADAHAALARALEALSQFEQSYGGDGRGAAHAVGQGCVGAQALAAASAAHASEALQPLRDYQRALPNAFAALHQREAALRTVRVLEADKAAAERKVALAGPSTSIRRLESLRLQITQLEAAREAAEGEYRRQAACNAEEVVAFRKQRSREAAAAVVALAAVQARCEERTAETWAAVAAKVS